jgi:hypothetical protein
MSKCRTFRATVWIYRNCREIQQARAELTRLRNIGEVEK